MLYELAGTRTRILGSLHLVPRGKADWVAPVREVFEWSQRLIVEIRAEHAASAITLACKAMAREMPADLYRSVESGWPPGFVAPLERCNLLGACMLAGAFGLASEEGVESALRRWAGPHAEVGELETAEAFAQVADAIPLDDLLWMTRRALRPREELQREFEANYRAWRLHDLARLQTLVERGTTPAARRALFADRNRAWAPAIAEAAGSSMRTLVVCGAGHLCGEDNLRDVLAAAHGFELRRLAM